MLHVMLSQGQSADRLHGRPALWVCLVVVGYGDRMDMLACG